MSYCVNCGVELDGSLEECPLCNTPVFNPRELPRRKKVPPFPKEKGTVEMVKRKDLGILLTALAVGASVTCGLLNLLVFSSTLWSLPIVGLCVLLWVIMIPAVIYTRQPAYLSVFFDGLAVMLYLYMISYMTEGNRWLVHLGLPIVVYVTLVAETVVLCFRKLPRSFLTVALYFFTETAALCIGLEILIDRYLRLPQGEDLGLEPFWGGISLGWSAIVLTVCVIVDITIITLLSRRRLRNAVRRRLHF
ncbi:MAG: DUF6320 domain-containing protein [Clostridium sp.]|jgi:hypothetical protein|nr:DUF6320 domain-containing protein [Clostridium sp.]